MEDIIRFLELNGFEKMNEPDHYANDMCGVVFERDDNGYSNYAVANNRGDVMYSYDINIYWLIGVLTYYGYMRKNYKQ